MITRKKRIRAKYIDNISDELREQLNAIPDSLIIGVFNEEDREDVILGYTIMSNGWMRSRSVKHIESLWQRYCNYEFVARGMSAWVNKYGFKNFYRQDIINEKYNTL